MDILREITADELDYIVFRLQEDLPFAMRTLYYIYSAQIFKSSSGHKNLSVKVLPTFYTHRYGLKENCTIFGITGKEDHTVWYFSFDDSLKEIEEVLQQTKLIRWKTEFLFVTLHSHQIEPVLNYVKDNGIKNVLNDECSYFYLPIEEALSFKIDVPSNVIMTELNESDAALCNNLWMYKGTNSEFYVKSLIAVLGGYALRDKVTNELLSFAIINDHLAIGLLNTVDKAKKRGYGELVAKYTVKKIAEMNLVPHVYISKYNHASNKLFAKLGFVKIGDISWLKMKGE